MEERRSDRLAPGIRDIGTVVATDAISRSEQGRPHSPCRDRARSLGRQRQGDVVHVDGFTSEDLLDQRRQIVSGLAPHVSYRPVEGSTAMARRGAAPERADVSSAASSRSVRPSPTLLQTQTCRGSSNSAVGRWGRRTAASFGLSRRIPCGAPSDLRGPVACPTDRPCAGCRSAPARPISAAARLAPR